MIDNIIGNYTVFFNIGLLLVTLTENVELGVHASTRLFGHLAESRGPGLFDEGRLIFGSLCIIYNAKMHCKAQSRS